MRALILTNAPIRRYEQYLINRSDVFKVAVNFALYQADYRVIVDVYYRDLIKQIFDESIVQRVIDPTVSNDERITYDHSLYFQQGTLTSAVSFAINQGCTDILLVANNKKYSDEFQTGISAGIDHLKQFANIYQYRNGNFNLPVVKIKDFLSYDLSQEACSYLKWLSR